MKKQTNPDQPERRQDNQHNPDPEGYPLYPPSQDIYSQFKEEQDIDPEDPSKIKDPIEKDPIEIDPDEEDIEELGDDIMGSDLDVPGSDLDDDQEEVGSEDEENNYYSIGGDNHHDLEDNDGIEDLDI